MNIHSEKLEYKKIKTVGVTVYRTRHLLSILDEKKALSSKPLKNEKKNVHKIECAHLQYVKNQYAIFEVTGMNTLGVIYYTNWHPLSFSDGKMTLFNTLQKREQNCKMCTK